jgi:hypothetical protein
MDNAIHEKINPIFPRILAFFGCLTTLFTHASAPVSTQSISLLSANDIQELEDTKVEDRKQLADLNTLLTIEIRTEQCFYLSEASSLLPSVRIVNT